MKNIATLWTGFLHKQIPDSATIFIFVAFILLYFVLQLWILPKLGIRT